MRLVHVFGRWSLLHDHYMYVYVQYCVYRLSKLESEEREGEGYCVDHSRKDD